MKEFNVICPYDQAVVGRVTDMTACDFEKPPGYAVEEMTGKRVCVFTL